MIFIVFDNKRASNSGGAIRQSLSKRIMTQIPTDMTTNHPSTAQVMSVMRLCGREIGLSPQTLRTLEVLLSCLAPKRNHHMVFASNATLVSRSGGLSERSIRRHIAQLVEMNLAERSDSANGKRYSRHDPVAGMTIRFGFDFTKLFQRFDIFSALAEDIVKRQQQLHYLRCKLRAAAQRILLINPNEKIALEARNAARRNLSADDYETLLKSLLTIAEAPPINACPDSESMASSGGQNDRHYSNFNIEYTEKIPKPNIAKLIDYCTEAQSFSVMPIKTPNDIINHATKLAPMIGIGIDLLNLAIQQKNRLDVAASIWLIIQNMPQIAKPAGYFRSITIGKRSAKYSPWNWLKLQTRKICPRTICNT